MASAQSLILAVALAIVAYILPNGHPARRLPRREADSLWLLFAAAPVALVSAILLVTVRLASTRSLWLDEFGTLWVIRGRMGEVAERVYAFHGQSPLYYYAPWETVRLLGESALVLRLPSILSVVGASVAVASAARIWFGRRALLPALVFTWCLPPVLGAAIDARPYALALVGFGLVWLGYARATNGKASGRLFFVGGGLLLFWTHYMLALSLIGIAAAYMSVPLFRGRYEPRSFLLDLIGISALSTPGLPHLYDLWQRRAALAWIDATYHSEWLVLVFPTALVAALSLTVRSRARLWTDARLRGTAIALTTPIVVMYGLSLLGLNLLASRYLLPTTLTAVLHGVGLVVTMTPRLRRAASVLFVGSAFIGPAITGSVRIGVPQDWTSVRTILDEERAADPQVLVLYRSGFVEQDTASSIPDVHVAPLQPPSASPFRGEVMHLTFSWSAEAETRLRTGALPALERGRTLLLVSPRYYSARTGVYGELVSDWISEQVPEVRVDRLDCCNGVEIVRFVPRATAAGPRVGIRKPDARERPSRIVDGSALPFERRGGGGVLRSDQVISE